MSARWTGAATLLLLLSCECGAAGAAEDAAAARAVESALATAQPFVAAAEAAPLVAVGRVLSRTEVDASAYAAQLELQRVVAGTAPGGALRVVWEELASQRAPRWAEGDTVLVALAAAPGTSLWRGRFGDGEARWTIAAAGDGYVRDPDERGVALLGEYLALAPPRLAAAAGVSALVSMVEEAQPALAAAALRRLRDDSGLAIAGAAATALLRAAGDERRPLALRRAIVALAGRRRIENAEPLLRELVARRGALEAPAYEALAALTGGLAEAEVETLLDSDEAALRSVAALYARGDLAERRLPELIRADPAPAVRAAAVRAAVASRTTWGLAAALPALGDPAAEVRGAAIPAIAALGTPALAPLAAEVRDNTPAAAGAITALSLMGEPGHAELRAVARDNPDEKLRKLALFALGEVQDEHSAKRP